MKLRLAITLLYAIAAARMPAGVMDTPTNRTIQLATLVQAYDGNEFAADQQYKGQLFAVAGVIDKITKGEGDVPMVSFRTPIRSHVVEVRCYFTNATGLDNLRTGGMVNLRGVIDGLHDDRLIIKQCLIVR